MQSTVGVVVMFTNLLRSMFQRLIYTYVFWKAYMYTYSRGVILLEKIIIFVYFFCFVFFPELGPVCVSNSILLLCFQHLSLLQCGTLYDKLEVCDVTSFKKKNTKIADKKMTKSEFKIKIEKRQRYDCFNGFVHLLFMPTMDTR